MYSEIFIVDIKNPEGAFTERYLIDYNGELSIEEIESAIRQYIKKHRYFNSSDFTKEFLNDMSNCYYLENRSIMHIEIPVEDWNIDAENIPF